MGEAPLSHYRKEENGMVTTTLTYTPWGWTRDVEELADGVLRVSTPGHGGLKLSRERWDELPAAVRNAMLTPTFAEEDCEEPIVRTLLGLGDDRDREMALTVAGYFSRYAPALPFIRSHPPGLHYHVQSYRGNDGSNPFGRFDTRVEAESYTNDPDVTSKYGRMEVIECSQAHPLCQQAGVKP